ncbi:tRNA lysidine(34) synthetase TilS [Bdellovibrio svalbardensis]|uniref:tRNA(Ile)-lysidine synthase n=1 Tax=Bdellovibrio svalbardensis TaxID=2972972 RepID=A0ABT6DLI9_9BACT|nr:tRNA lysidine(34) synthetase TilS [Bdellovibrio svalbardensis]MDG0816676.1 tRNA lysidine(34) synthetase TilS [Bdellovibrio svalbardensis]
MSVSDKMKSSNERQSKAKQDLDHQVWKQIRQYSLQNKKILVALSGGVDSTALLRVLSKVHKKELLAACYFHHGEDSNTEYRKEAQIFCEKLCSKLGVKFHALKSSELAKSEAQYRELRYEALQRLMMEEDFQVLATGHHRDDLLETRLLRLIRGTGAQGFQAMLAYKDKVFRPFLEVNKKELKKYLREEKIRSLEDPTNVSLDPLRNWLREEWLKSLEKRQKGALVSLARSLETIAEEISFQGIQAWGDLLSQNESYKSQGLSRAFYLTLSPFEQRRLLAQYLFSLGKKDFSQSQLEEIQKRLDKSQKVITFKVSGCEWLINAEQIKVQS